MRLQTPTRKAPAKKSPPAYAVPALDKGLDVIECLAKTATPQGHADLARLLKRSPNEIFRTIVRLEQRGYIRKETVSGKFQLTLKLFTISHTHSTIDSILQAARLPMRKLAEETRQSCHLGVLYGSDLLVIAHELAPTPVRISVEVGYLVAAQKTTTGRLLSALLPDGEYRELFGDFLPEVAEIRRRGWLIEPSPQLKGVRNIVVPVRIPGGHAGLFIPWIGMEEEEELILLRACQKASEAITAAIPLE